MEMEIMTESYGSMAQESSDIDLYDKNTNAISDYNFRQDL